MTRSEMRLKIRNEVLESGESGRSTERGLCTENIRFLMQKSNITVKQLAEKTGFAEQTMRTYLTGKSSPSLRSTIVIADFFHVPVDFLVDRCSSQDAEQIFENYQDYFSVLHDASLDVYLLNKYAEDDYMKTDKVSVFPYNLMEAIMMKDDNACIEFCESGLETAISRLTEREQELINLRYREEMTLEEVSKNTGLGRERVRQIVAKACRKLRHPSNLQLIQMGSLGVKKKSELMAYEERLKEKERVLKLKEADLKKLSEELALRDSDKTEPEDDFENDVRYMPIEYLNLSVRAYNCLKRAGIDTIGKAADRAANGDIHKIRNMGVRSTLDVLDRLMENGCGDFHDRYDFGGC